MAAAEEVAPVALVGSSWLVESSLVFGVAAADQAQVACWMRILRCGVEVAPDSSCCKFVGGPSLGTDFAAGAGCWPEVAGALTSTWLWDRMRPRKRRMRMRRKWGRKRIAGNMANE